MRTYITLDKAWVASGDVDKFISNVRDAGSTGSDNGRFVLGNRGSMPQQTLNTGAFTSIARGKYSKMSV
jgi:hypothetical protein